MKVILVDSRYFGNALRVSRKTVKLCRIDAAAILGMTQKEFDKMEAGNTYPTSDVLQRILANGYARLKERHGVGDWGAPKQTDI